jgi:hypothetical protein
MEGQTLVYAPFPMRTGELLQIQGENGVVRTVRVGLPVQGGEPPSMFAPDETVYCFQVLDP